MSTLQILGIAALALPPVAGFFGWKLYAKSKAADKLGADFEKALTVLPQLELNLQPSAIESWVDDSRIKTNEIALREAGLVHHGYFVNRTSLRKLQVSLWQFKNSLTVALCENQFESENVDDDVHTQYSCHAIVRLNNGATLRVTNSQVAAQLRFSSENPVIVTSEVDPIRLMRMIKSHLPTDVKLVPIQDCQASFIHAYECQSHWLWQAEQLRSAEVQNLLEEQGIEVTDALLHQLEQHGQSFLSQIYSHKILERLGQTPNMSPAQWQEIRGKCVVIHEKMSAEDLSSALFQTLTDLTSAQTKELESLGDGGPIRDPIMSFQGYLDSFSNGAATKRIAKMQQPVRAEIYLAD